MLSSMIDDAHNNHTEIHNWYGWRNQCYVPSVKATNLGKGYKFSANMIQLNLSIADTIGSQKKCSL